MTTKKTSQAAAAQTFTIKPSELKASIVHLLDKKLSLFVWGAPGIGKSAVLKQVADENGMDFVDIRLSQMDPTDIRGIPYPTEENGVKGMRWSAPLVLPHDPNARTIILLDEFNSAPPSVQAAETRVLRSVCRLRWLIVSFTSKCVTISKIGSNTR